jgi:hypothetical protein
MRFRYRTPVLIGKWRSRSDAALEDAIAAGQAERGADGVVLWRVEGHIEAEGEGVSSVRLAS